MPAPPLAASTELLGALQLGPLAIFGLLYARRVRTLALGGHAVPGWRQGCFYAGFVVIGVALTSLGKASQELLFVHMVEHLLLGDIAALLIVLGLTGPLIAPILKIRVFDRLRVLANPLIAFPMWLIDFYGWHLPVFYQAALENSWVHALEHMMFLGFGINMWMCLFGPLPMPAWFGSSTSLLCGSLVLRSATSFCGRALSSTPTTCLAIRAITCRLSLTRTLRGR
jgi:putative membrane protein